MARDITVHFVGNARDLATAAALAGESVERFGHKAAVAGAESAAASAGFNLVGTAFDSTASQAMGLGTALESIGDGMPPLIPVAIAYAAALTVALAPALAYTLGLTSALGLALGALGGFGLLGAGFIALAARSQGWLTAADNLKRANEELAKAQEAVERSAKPTKAQLDRLADAQKAAAEATVKADNPWTRFTDHLNKMADTLGQKATPMATQLLGWMDSLLPKVEGLGTSLLGWFGDRLPKVLPIASKMFDDVLGALKRLGAAVTPMFDDLIKHPEKYERAFNEAANGIIEAVKGIIGDLDQLASWWSRHPEMVRDAQVTFQLIGDAMSVTIRSLERMAEDADWAYQNLTRLWNWVHGGGGGRGGGGGGGEGFTAQHGGIFPAGSMVRVGEVAEEMAYALPGGGLAVTPLGGGRGGGGSRGPYNITMYVSGGADPEQIAAAVDRRLSRLLTAT